MTRRKRIGTRRIAALQRVHDRALRRRKAVARPTGWRRRFGRRAERTRPWLQFLADLAAIFARVVS
ncbi:hypothetical protein AB0I00_17385 [Streptomyces sp. NPDC050803]|uniref:hypothetical protein n=1 Tax=unclassified Streptomyces TaxID=2593676 RepID=UPI00343DD428